MPGWNFADVWEIVAEHVPDAPAQVQGDRALTWARVRPAGRRRRPHAARRRRDASRTRSRSTSTTAPSTSSRCSPSSRPGWSPVNTNYRYADDELVYLWDNADAVAVVFHGAFAERIERHPRPGAARPDLALGRRRHRARAPTGRRPTRTAAAVGSRTRAVAPWGRGGDDLYCSTPAAPPACPRASCGARTTCSAASSARVEPRRSATPSRTSTPSATRSPRPGPSSLPACPLMHGTGLFTASSTCAGGGCDRHAREPQLRRRSSCSTRSSASASTSIADRRRRVRQADAARPRRRARTAGTSRALVRRSSSSGVMWSARRPRQGLLAPPPRHDHRRRVLGSSRGARHGPVGVRPPAAAADTAKFTLGANTRVITDDGRDVEPGSGEIGRVARRRLHAGRLLQGRGEVGGHVPHRSTASATRSPATTPTVDADGTLTPARPRLGVHQHRRREGLPRGGRGGAQDRTRRCADAVVVGVPDEKFGEAITAVVEPTPGADARRGRDSSPT